MPKGSLRPLTILAATIGLTISVDACAEEALTKEEVRAFIANFQRSSCLGMQYVGSNYEPAGRNRHYSYACGITVSPSGEVVYTNRTASNDGLATSTFEFGFGLGALDPSRVKTEAIHGVTVISLECTNSNPCIRRTYLFRFRGQSRPPEVQSTDKVYMGLRNEEQANRLVRAYTAGISMHGGKVGAF